MKKKTNCNFCLIVCDFLICIIFLVGVILPISFYYTMNTVTCTLNNITYPTEIPTLDSTQNWESCDCGKRCIAWSPCVNIYVTVDNNTVLVNNLWAFGSTLNTCTIHNSSCPTGEDARYLNQELEWAKQIAEEYAITYENITTCYEFNNNIYLGKYISWVLVGIISAIFVILLIISLFSIRK